jgi:hypothetical protein
VGEIGRDEVIATALAGDIRLARGTWQRAASK